MSLLKTLNAFRSVIYSCLMFRSDANMNTLDALSSYGHQCKSVVELSEAPCFERQYTSITDGIADGLGSCQWQKITEATYQSVDKSDNNDRIVLVVDCTPNQRAAAPTLKDRHITYFPNPAPGNKPICVGHEYSTVAMVPDDAASRDKHWLIPLSTERVQSDQKGHEVGMEQIENVINDCKVNNKLVISVADSKYGSEFCRKRVSQNPNWVHLFRLNSTRKVYSQAQEKPTTRKKGNYSRYGQAMTLNDPDTHRQADEEIRESITTRRGQPCTLKIKAWHNQLVRGSRTFKGYEHPMTIFQITLIDQHGKQRYKKPMWLALTGKRRNELTAKDIFEYYRCRYDIEHFFRFGKDKLLIDAYQTPDVAHEESWWKLSSLAYTQLYFARDAVPLLPRKWERYLPSYQVQADQEKQIATPSQAQRGFSIVLDKIGTPARPCVARGNPKGRSLGEKQTKREKQPVIFKTKTELKSGEKCIISQSEQSGKNSVPQKIKLLVKNVKTQLQNANYDANEFHDLLLKAT